MAHPVILFDGVCNLCNRAVVFVTRRDPNRIFRFAPLQSKTGQALLARHGIPDHTLDSLVLVEDTGYATRSTAALRIARRLRAPWPALAVFFVVPRPVRDAVYDWVASNRYKWFGRRETCMVPSRENRARFLD